MPRTPAVAPEGLGAGLSLRSSRQPAALSVAVAAALVVGFAAPGGAARAAGPPPKAQGRPAVLTVKKDRFYMNGRPIQLWGVRTAAATKDQKLTDHLIAQLDDYKAHGVNAVTVFYTGCSGASYDPFTPDGRGIDRGHQRRLEQIIQACAKREMVVVVGIFYQRAPFGLRDAAAVRNAVRAVTEALKPHRNVLLNVANEQNSNYWKKAAAVFDFRDPERVIELCELVHKTDPRRLVGGGGYDVEKNKVIGKSRHVDALLFDFNVADSDPVKLYEGYVAAGVKDKPVVNVELFGAYTGKFERGVFPDAFKKLHYKHVDAAAGRPGLSVFLHNTPWCQQEPMRYDLGGRGTKGDPGLRWYFEYVRDKLPPASGKRGKLVFPAKEWAAAKPESQGLDGAKLKKGLAKLPHAGNVAVVRNGYLVATHGDVSDSRINIYSASKSVTALLCARLLQQGEVKLDDLLPRSDYPAGPRASYRHFLTMTSDYDLKPHEPGKHFAYNNIAVRFYGEHMLLQYFPGRSAAEAIREALFQPLRHQDPISTTRRRGTFGAPWAGGQQVSARDLARLGLLVLAEGNWDGTQLVPATFCQALYRNQVPDGATVSKSTGTEGTGTNMPSNQQRISPMLKGNYSFGWWNNDGGRLGKRLPRDVTYASGRGGNYVIVVPEWNVVVAVTNTEPERKPPPEAYLRVVQDALGKP